MGIFTKGQRNIATSVYEDAKKYLKPKDGYTHVVMFNSFSKLNNEIFCCEDKYTTQIDEIVSRMQDDGYEIVDIKVTILQNQGSGFFGDSMEGYSTLIIYK